MSYVPTETPVVGALAAKVLPIDTVICLDPSRSYTGVRYDLVRVDAECLWLIEQLPGGLWRTTRGMRDLRDGIATDVASHAEGAAVERCGTWRWDGGWRVSGL